MIKNQIQDQLNFANEFRGDSNDRFISAFKKKLFGVYEEVKQKFKQQQNSMRQQIDQTEQKEKKKEMKKKFLSAK
jgi:hypothetical protein